MIYTVTLNPALDRELTVPEIQFDEVLRASEVRLDWGGKGFNVSRMLAALDVPSIALGFAGGSTGETLQIGLESLGIQTDFTPIAGETRTNVSLVTPAHSHYLKVNEKGPTISASEQATLMRQIEALVKPDDWWVLAGSLPPGVPASFYAELTHEIKAGGGRVILDTSGEPLRLGCAAQPYMIKPNGVELTELTGQPADSMEQALQAARILDGIEYIAVSLGSTGALLIQHDHAWFAPAPSIIERNSIGAGDSMLAGLLSVFQQDSQANPAEVLRYGVACGAATAAKSGTSLGTRAEVENLAQQIKIESLF